MAYLTGRKAPDELYFVVQKPKGSQKPYRFAMRNPFLKDAPFENEAAAKEHVEFLNDTDKRNTYEYITYCKRGSTPNQGE